MDFDSGSHYVRINSGTVEAYGFSTPVIYIDGTATTTFPDTGWHQIMVTTNSSFNASNLVVGLAASNYYSGSIDDVRLYNRVLSTEEIGNIYRAGSVEVRK